MEKLGNTSKPNYKVIDIGANETNDINKLIGQSSGLTGADFKDIIIPLQEDNNFNINKLVNEILGIGDIDSLDERELNRYIYLIELYLENIKEFDPLKAQKINSLMIDKFLNNTSVNFIRKGIMIQNDILGMLYTGNYIKIERDFEKYIIYIESIIKDINGEDGEVIFKLDILTHLFVNLSLCTFNFYSEGEIDRLGSDILKILGEKGLQRHYILVQTAVFKNKLKINNNGTNNKLDTDEIDKKIEDIQKKGYKLDFLQFSEKDNYQYNITKLEILINCNGSDTEIENLIKEINNVKEKEYDLDIHFKYLKALYLLKKEKNILGNTKENVLNLIEKKEQTDYKKEVKDTLIKILKDNRNTGNKMLLINTLFLLINIEKEEEEKIEIKKVKTKEKSGKKRKKEEEYFFMTYGIIERHFGGERNYFRDELLKVGNKLFPGESKENINDLYRLYKLEFEQNQDYQTLKGDSIENGNALLNDLEGALKENFGIKELFLFNYGNNLPIICSGFNKNNPIGAVCECSKDNCPIMKENVKLQLNENSWTEISLYENDITGIIKSHFFSGTLIGKIITVGPEKIITLVSKGRCDEIDFTNMELIKIESLYITRFINELTIKKYSIQDIESRKKINRLYKEQRILNEELKKLNQKLKDQSEVKDMFSAIIAHDFNNLLQVLLGHLELIGFQIIDENIPSDKKVNVVGKALPIINDATKKLTGLSASLKEIILAISSKGEINLNISKIGVNDLLKNIIFTQEGSPLYMDKNIDISFNSESDIDIKGDEIKLYFVISNIIGNALKYVDNNGEIKVKTRKEGENFIIEISDNGIGISNEDLDNIFGFLNQGGDIDNKILGTGIGLAAAKAIIEAHGGAIKVQSEEGEGSKFIIKLPIQ